LKAIIDDFTTIYCGDSKIVLKEYPDNYFDSVVTDPPYFLIDQSGNGFMRNNWDGISDLWKYLWIENTFVNFAERFFIELKAEKILAEQNIVRENVLMRESNLKTENLEFVLPVEKNLKLSKVQKNDFAEVLAITKPELLELLNHLPIKNEFTQFLCGEKEDAKYVIPISLLEKEVKNVVVENALKNLTKLPCWEKTTRHILMDEVKTREIIGGMTGTKLEKKYIEETNINVECVENIVVEKKFNAITLSPIEKLKIIEWITLLLCALNAIRLQKKIQKYMIENFFKVTFAEIYRVLKPGAHILAFGGTRTYHLLVNGIEDAGFEIRDQVQWIYGQGFPKSYDISKGIDKELKAERKVIGRDPYYCAGRKKTFGDGNKFGTAQGGDEETAWVTAPATLESEQWNGWGTALKPANEPICLARKPISEKTIVKNVLKWGVGGINIDDSRIELNGEIVPINKLENWSGFGQEVKPDYEQKQNTKGRFPANVIMDEEAGKILDEQSGDRSSARIGNSNNPIRGSENSHPLWGMVDGRETVDYRDSGGASRFFYCAKVSKKERGDGNDHPTVKPQSLMEYLVKLVTPPDGIVLDPFMGSGSTGLATKNLHYRFVGIDLEQKYFDIAQRRLFEENTWRQN
jgi:site-specific DNA-methyltransferase (adenine-specific)